jgi:hypothetical protein
MGLNLIFLLEWSALAVALLWTFGLGGIAMGTRKARRAFRGKGYLRPPAGKGLFRFLYFKHYESFEDPFVRFYFRVARLCLFAFFVLVLVVGIFVGSIYLLRSVTSGVPAATQQSSDG